MALVLQLVLFSATPVVVVVVVFVAVVVGKCTGRTPPTLPRGRAEKARPVEVVATVVVAPAVVELVVAVPVLVLFVATVVVVVVVVSSVVDRQGAMLVLARIRGPAAMRYTSAGAPRSRRQVRRSPCLRAIMLETLATAPQLWWCVALEQSGSHICECHLGAAPRPTRSAGWH